MSRVPTISVRELLHALALRDLSDPSHGPHAVQHVLDGILAALAPIPIHVERASPVVSIADNYDRLGYPAGGAARDSRYTRYVCDTALLRTQTSAMIPPLLARAWPADIVLVCPGLVYRRDVIDRLHVGEPHQVDLWRLARHPLDARDLDELIARVVAAAVPDTPWRTLPTEHPYTTAGRQIDVAIDDRWIEIGECGLASPALLPPNTYGLAIGLGLDRLVMLRKGLDDIRLLRARDPRIASQMLDLAPYRPVSMMPAVCRDLSISVRDPPDPEALGDRIRAALGERAELVEAVELREVTPGRTLPASARERLGMHEDEHNALVRLTLRALDRTLTHAECNALRDDVYAAIHEGRRHTWAAH